MRQVKCTNPYDRDQTAENDLFATSVAWAHTGIFLICVVFGAMQARLVARLYDEDSLQLHFGGHDAASAGSTHTETGHVSEFTPPLQEAAPMQSLD